jgi:hypothetical protein
VGADKGLLESSSDVADREGELALPSVIQRRAEHSDIVAVKQLAGLDLAVRRPVHIDTSARQLAASFNSNP